MPRPVGRRVLRMPRPVGRPMATHKHRRILRMPRPVGRLMATQRHRRRLRMPRPLGRPMAMSRRVQLGRTKVGGTRDHRGGAPPPTIGVRLRTTPTSGPMAPTVRPRGREKTPTRRARTTLGPITRFLGNVVAKTSCMICIGACTLAPNNLGVIGSPTEISPS